MTLTVPAWLRSRNGDLRPGLNSATVLVLLNGHPEYKLVATPASGKFTCVITQTINGKRIDFARIYPSVDACLSGGLEEVREKLGW